MSANVFFFKPKCMLSPAHRFTELPNQFITNGVECTYLNIKREMD